MFIIKINTCKLTSVWWNKLKIAISFDKMNIFHVDIFILERNTMYKVPNFNIALNLDICKSLTKNIWKTIIKWLLYRPYLYIIKCTSLLMRHSKSEPYLDIHCTFVIVEPKINTYISSKNQHGCLSVCML